MGQISHLRRSRSLGPAVICGLAALLYFGFADAGSAATVTVCPVGGAQTTIQAGVNAAAAGDTIQVCAGTFPEQVLITKSVKLVGAGSAQTTIILPRPVTGTQDVVTVDGVQPGRRRRRDQRLHDQRPRPDGRVRAGRDDVPAFRHLRPQRREREHPRQRDHRHARRPDRRLPERVGNQGRPRRHADVGYGDDHEQHDLRLPEDRDHRRQRRLGATITGNTITGVGPTNAIAQNGMQISRGAVATVTGNRVSRERVHGQRSPRPGCSSSARSAR